LPVTNGRFLGDVSSFTNAAGGDLIYGVLGRVI